MKHDRMQNQYLEICKKHLQINSVTNIGEKPKILNKKYWSAEQEQINIELCI